MFVAEATGRPGFIVPGLIAAVVAELIIGNSSVTAYQRGPERSEEETGDVAAQLESSRSQPDPSDSDGAQPD